MGLEESCLAASLDHGSWRLPVDAVTTIVDADNFNDRLRSIFLLGTTVDTIDIQVDCGENTVHVLDVDITPKEVDLGEDFQYTEEPLLAEIALKMGLNGSLATVLAERRAKHKQRLANNLFDIPKLATEAQADDRLHSRLYIQCMVEFEARHRRLHRIAEFLCKIVNQRSELAGYDQPYKAGIPDIINVHGAFETDKQIVVRRAAEELYKNTVLVNNKLRPIS